MAATHTRPARRRPRRALRLPRLGWGWALIALIIFGFARTWPIQTIAVVALTAIGLIIAARKPAWLQRAARRLPVIQRSHLPARGHRTLRHFQNLTPGRFEQAIAELALEDPRVHTATVLGGSGDNGMDVRVQLANGTHILVQCKRNKAGNNVSSSTIRETVGSVVFHDCHTGAIVTTADFTRDAYATNAGLRQPLRLLTGRDLEAWANGHAPAPW